MKFWDLPNNPARRKESKYFHSYSINLLGRSGKHEQMLKWSYTRLVTFVCVQIEQIQDTFRKCFLAVYMVIEEKSCIKVVIWRGLSDQSLHNQ